MLSLYYGIGRYISANSREGFWGTGAIKTISERLRKELPGLKGFSQTNLKYMRIFYEEWSPIIEAKNHKSSAVADEINTDSLLPVKSSAVVDDLEKFLKLRGCFFILEQLKYPADKRYDAFLANILSYPGKKIPNDITILTWNYDSQFEIAYREFNSTNQPSASYWKGVRKQLGIKDSHDTEFENGKIFKLNGTAIFDYFHSFSLLGESCVDDFKNTIGSIADVHTQFNPNNHLYFAWESSPTSQYFKELYPHISNAETLVVIGYTFPYFNRVIDRSIFETMGSLKKIYIQDPFAERIHQNINPVLSVTHTSINKVQIYELKDVDQFYLPAEL